MIHDEAFGLSKSHLVECDNRLLHSQVKSHWRRLQQQAEIDGLTLHIVSSFRGFDQQSAIWNKKATGERAILDDDSHVVDIAKLSEEEVLWAILRYSALPGASRHHWGTDLDVYAVNLQPQGIELQLTPEEYEQGGTQHQTATWLQQKATTFGFFHPYSSDLGGVAVEKWHISHQKLSQTYQDFISIERLFEVIKNTDLALKSAILRNLDEIYQRFVININQ